MSSGLQLVANYNDASSSDDDSENERRGVKRTKDDDDSNEEDKQAKKRASLEERLPMPDGIRSMFKDIIEAETHVDDPNQHQGRKRTFEHVRGNWATYVYAKFPSEMFKELQHELKDRISVSDKDIQFHFIDEPHLSFTKVVTLRHHWIEPFVSSIKSSFRSTKAHSTGKLFWKDFRVLVNDDRSRTFLALTVQDPKNVLAAISAKMDKIMEEFGLPKFYDPPIYHVSLLWCLGDQQTTFQHHLNSINPYADELLSNCDLNRDFNVEELYCKSGNKSFVVKV